MFSPALLRCVIAGYTLRLEGTHGIGHWARVMENGRRLAAKTGADGRVVDLFALFHDCRRMNDGHDPDHGLRGAQLAAAMRGSCFDLEPKEFELLHEACAQHTLGYTDADITVQTCWDADRLDLGRVGRRPKRDRLCTEAARSFDLMNWAHRRAVRNIVPSVVSEWMKCIDPD